MTMPYDKPRTVSIRPLVLRFLLAFLSIFFLAGCGGSQPTLLAANPNGLSSVSLSGKLDLGAPIPHIPVVVSSLNGNTLASATTDSVGEFSIPNFQAPPDFTVIASLGQDLEFATEVRGYDGSGRYVVINAPTSLISRELALHPGQTLEQASAKIRDLLQVPSGRSLEYGIEEAVRQPFSHIAFFQAAAAAGGWSSYRDALLSQAVAPPSIGFRLTRATAQAPMALLDERLRPYLESYLSQRSTKLDLVSHEANPAPSFSVLNEGLLANPSSPELHPQAINLSQVRGSVLTTIAKDLVHTGVEVAKDQIIDVGWTHIADALNLNYGTTRMLEIIQDQLHEITDMLTDLSEQISELSLQTATSTISDDINKIQELFRNLANVNGGSDGIGGTPGTTPGNTTSGTDLANPETPYTKPADVVTLLNTLATFTATVSLSNIQDEMLGTNGTFNILTQNRSNVYSSLGITPTADTGFAPVRSKLILDKLLATVEYYSQVQQNACTVIGELSHVTNANPASDMVSAYHTINSAAISLKKQRGQLPPFFLSDKVVIDLQGGVMWYVDAHEPTDYQTANNNANNFVLDVGNGVVYDDWRIPSDQELYFLQDRARLVNSSQRNPNVKHDGNDSSAGNYGYSAQGLSALGFNPSSLSHIDSDGMLWCYDYSWVNPLFDDGYWTSWPFTFRFNHSNAVIDGGGAAAPTDHISYFYVRSIGKPVYNDDRNAPSGHYPYHWSDVKPGEYSTLGTITSLSYADIVSGKAGVVATYTIKTGGSVTLGGGNASDSYTFPTFTYTGYVDSYHGYGSDYAGPVDLASLIFYEPQTNELSIGYRGDLYWHNTTVGKSSSVPVKASVMSTKGSLISTTGNFNLSSTPVRTLTSIQIWPRNKQYDMTATALSNEHYYCLAYYSDQTIEDVTSSTFWSVARKEGGIPTAARFSTTIPNELLINNTATENLVITASFNGHTDTSSGLAYNT